MSGGLVSGASTGQGRQAALLPALQAAWERAGPAVVARVEALEDAVAALVEGRLDEDTRARAERDAHKVAGSAGTFGFRRVSDLARDLERLLAVDAPRDQAVLLRACGLVEGMRQELSTSPGTPPFPASPRSGSAEGVTERPARRRSDDASPEPGPTPPTTPRPDTRTEEAAPDEGRLRLLVVHADAETTDQVAAAAAARGMQCATAHDAAAARRVAAEVEPDVVLVDLALAGGDAEQLLSDFAMWEPPVLMLVLGGGDVLVDRVTAARAGARGFLPRALPPERLVGAVAAWHEGQESGASRLLAVDDDPAVLEALRAVFDDGSSHRLTTLDSPLRFWEVLERTRPHLVVLDVDMPDVNGIELCRLIRADDRWAGLPILVLTGAIDPKTMRDVFTAGADDYIAKPIVGPELRMRVRNRLERVRLYSRLADTDPLTGLANRRKFDAEMERLGLLASQYRLPLSFALLDLDRFKQVNDRYGHAVGDTVLQRLATVLAAMFRADDVVCRWGGGEIALGMYGMSRADGVERVAEALAEIREQTFRADGGHLFRVTISAGVGEYGVDGRVLHDVYRATDEVLHQAKALGGDRVLPAGWRPTAGDRERLADVVVVDDDPVLTDLLTHALETRGLRVVCLADGAAALHWLTGPDRMRSRVVLLDIDLPEINGFDVLRRLRRDGVLASSKVIVLTARCAEEEIVEALEQGAFDHIAKPFSVPVLLQRVRRALVS